MFLYKPAEDSYLTLKLLDKIGGGFDVCVDVGAGSCILSRRLAEMCRLAISTDINPRSCESCRGLGPVCSHGLSAVRRADLVVVNPPYLPPEEPPGDWEALAIYDYGLINHVIRWAFAYRPKLIVLTISSLGRIDFVEEALRALGFVVAEETIHVFFEDLISVAVAPYRFR
ncbi:MAG: methylase [Thermoproteus sp.]|nr:methylase [Thermoproteus sp.]